MLRSEFNRQFRMGRDQPLPQIDPTERTTMSLHSTPYTLSYGDAGMTAWPRLQTTGEYTRGGLSFLNDDWWGPIDTRSAEHTLSQVPDNLAERSLRDEEEA